jgi:hypothetical protein
MYNWSIDEEKFKREDPEGYKIWRLEQMINYGLDGEKIKEKEVKKYWQKIKERLDPYKRRLIEFLLWQKLYSLPNNLNFWNLPSKKVDS